MNELNNWDEYTIRHLINKLEIDAETARHLKDNYNLKAVNANPIDPNAAARPSYYRQRAFEQYGRESSCQYFLAYLREMLDANAEALAMDSRIK